MSKQSANNLKQENQSRTLELDNPELENSKSFAPPELQLMAGPDKAGGEALQLKDEPKAAADPLTFEQIKAVLKDIPTGKEALKRKEEYKTKVVFKAGGGSFYSSSTSTMTIDSGHTAKRAALTFVHEMNHAYYHKAGLKPRITKTTRAEYIKRKVAEEAEGVVKSIEAKMELEGAKVDVAGLTYPLEKQYKEAYKKKKEEVVKAGEKDEAKIAASARIAGKARVTKGFNDGEVVTSNSGDSYPVYYGNSWDKYNPKKDK